MYARKLTKEELMKSGITNITEDCRVFRGDQEVKLSTSQTGYLMLNIFEVDDNDRRIIIPYDKSVFGGVYKVRTVGLHRAMWAWHKNEVPEGMVVDHISNRHDRIEDYYLSNLQLLTPAENLAKERDTWNTSELKCNLNKPRSYYELKLEGYIIAYEQAKKDKDTEATHRLRSNVAGTRARLRYYDKHIEEYRNNRANEASVSEHECHARAAKRRELQANIDSARKFYKDMLHYYGKDDDITIKAHGEWKLAIAMMYGFKEETKKSKANIC